MPSAVSGTHAPVLIGIAVIQLVLGILAMVNSIFLVDKFDNVVRNYTVHANNLPLDANVLINGVMPVAIVIPQAIILPSIIGIVAGSARSRCLHAAHLVFAIASALWTPVQTMVALFYVLCYGFIYAQHLEEANSQPRLELLNVFFCFIGLFLISLITCFLTFASSVTSCCILCRCCETKHTRQRRWIIQQDGSDTEALLQSDSQSQASSDDQPPPPYSFLVPGPVGSSHPTWLLTTVGADLHSSARGPVGTVEPSCEQPIALANAYAGMVAPGAAVSCPASEPRQEADLIIFD